MNTKIKLFFLDLDGTLLDKKTPEGKVISEKNLTALQAGEDRGYQSCISTGRIGPKALNYLKMSGLDYAVTGNGSQIIDKTGKIIRELHITPDQMILIKDFISKHDLAMKIDNMRIAYNVKTPEGHHMTNKLNYEIADELDFDVTIQRVKLIIWGKNPDLLPTFAEKFMKAVPGVSVVSAERGWTLEVTNEKATKATGNLWIMKNIFKIDNPGACCHIGDTMNDFPVIGTLGYFVSPLDAQKDLLYKAPFITIPHYEGAVAEVMNGNFWDNPLKK